MRRALLLVCACLATPGLWLGCDDDEPELTAGLEVNSLARSMLEKVVVSDATRRVEVYREREGGPLLFRRSQPGSGEPDERCPAAPPALEALEPALSVRVKRPLDRSAARKRFAGMDAAAFATLEVHDAIKDSRPFTLRVLAPASGRSETYAVLADSELWFEVDGDVLALLDAHCPPAPP
jgi:hypothetical protein